MTVMIGHHSKHKRIVTPSLKHSLSNHAKALVGSLANPQEAPVRSLGLVQDAGRRLVVTVSAGHHQRWAFRCG